MIWNPEDFEPKMILAISDISPISHKVEINSNTTLQQISKSKSSSLFQPVDHKRLNKTTFHEIKEIPSQKKYISHTRSQLDNNYEKEALKTRIKWTKRIQLIVN